MSRLSKLIVYLLVMTMLTVSVAPAFALDTAQGQCSTGCQTEVLDQDRLGQVTSVIDLSASDSLIRQLKGTDDIRQFAHKGGEVIGWQEAQLVTYHGVKLQAVVVPIKSATANTSKSLLAYYCPDKKQFIRVLVFAMSITDESGQPIECYNKDLPLNGSMGFYDTQGNLISGARYENDQVVSMLEDEAGTVSALGYWDCVQSCLRTVWPNLPYWMQFLCEAACGSCIFAPNPWSCGACASCLGGYATGCLISCMDIVLLCYPFNVIIQQCSRSI